MGRDFSLVMWPSIAFATTALASLIRRHVTNSLARKRVRERFVVLITGVSGSGKSTLAQRLVQSMRENPTGGVPCELNLTVSMSIVGRRLCLSPRPVELRA